MLDHALFALDIRDNVKARVEVYTKVQLADCAASQTRQWK